jgi:hypothetical protein
MKAKTASKLGMIAGVLTILIYNAVYLAITKKIPTEEEQRSIIMLGLSLVIAFTPIYLNLILDKVVEIFGAIFNKDKKDEVQ